MFKEKDIYFIFLLCTGKKNKKKQCTLLVCLSSHSIERFFLYFLFQVYLGLDVLTVFFFIYKSNWAGLCVTSCLVKIGETSQLSLKSCCIVLWLFHTGPWSQCLPPASALYWFVSCIISPVKPNTGELQEKIIRENIYN